MPNSKVAPPNTTAVATANAFPTTEKQKMHRIKTLDGNQAKLVILTKIWKYALRIAFQGAKTSSGVREYKHNIKNGNSQ